VYRPIAAHLVARHPGPLAGRRVLDAGAGTGVASDALAAGGARSIGIDLSFDMLRCYAHPSAVGDLCALPLASRSVDDVVAAFVLNHFTDPRPGFAELMRVTRSGGAFLACVYSASNRSAVRDRVDQLAIESGWRVPDWYVDIKAAAIPVLGNAAAMETAARGAGLHDVVVDEVMAAAADTIRPVMEPYRPGVVFLSASA
jgi:ubiquinone/menaquinone biosynthesis C-methylase UbiE